MREYHKVGGVLTIVSGGIGVLSGIVVGLMIVFLRFLLQSQADFQEMPQDFWIIMALIYGLMALFLVLVGVLAIIGGVYAIRKKQWGLALAGAIAATMTFYYCGIIALIFITLAKNEFAPPNPPVNQSVSIPEAIPPL